MDEKSFIKGQSFVSILTDIAGNRVLAMVPEASTESGQQFLATLSGEQQQEIAAVANRVPQALKAARAWKSKELCKGFYDQPEAVQGRTIFMKWYGKAVRSRREPVPQVARCFLRSLPQLLTSFKHRISNAAAEGFNSVIQALKSAACGFRNQDHYRIHILFHCGKLNLLPSPHQSAKNRGSAHRIQKHFTGKVHLAGQVISAKIT